MVNDQEIEALSLVDKALEDAFLAGQHGPESKYVQDAAESERALRKYIIEKLL